MLMFRMMLATLALLGTSFVVAAQDKYPSRPIEIIVPYAPGGGSDIMLRNVVKIIEQHKLVPVPIAVVNKPGGGGAIARTQFSQARPDGYTLGVMDPNPVLQQLLGEAPQDYRKDFTYIAKLVDDVNFLIVKANSPIKTLADAVAEAKKRGQALHHRRHRDRLAGPRGLARLRRRDRPGDELPDHEERHRGAHHAAGRPRRRGLGQSQRMRRAVQGRSGADSSPSPTTSASPTSPTSRPSRRPASTW